MYLLLLHECLQLHIVWIIYQSPRNKSPVNMWMQKMSFAHSWSCNLQCILAVQSNDEVWGNCREWKHCRQQQSNSGFFLIYWVVLFSAQAVLFQKRIMVYMGPNHTFVVHKYKIRPWTWVRSCLPISYSVFIPGITISDLSSQLWKL